MLLIGDVVTNYLIIRFIIINIIDFDITLGHHQVIQVMMMSTMIWSGMSPARSPGTAYRPSPTTASSMWRVRE